MTNHADYINAVRSAQNALDSADALVRMISRERAQTGTCVFFDGGLAAALEEAREALRAVRESDEKITGASL